MGTRPDTVIVEMYRFLLRPKWIGFHLLVFGGVALMLWLGFWQLRRLDERKAFNETVVEQSEIPPVPLSDLLPEAEADPESVEWRQVTASGTWMSDQILWFNRTQNGAAGDNVLTALELDDGAVAVVNRGFVSLGFDTPPAPVGDVEILARVRQPHVRERFELTDSAAGPVSEVRRIDLDQLDAQIAGDVIPVYLDLIASEPEPPAGAPVPVPPPELSEGPHLSYAFQWFIFAFCALVGWVLAVRRSIRTRRRAAEIDDHDDADDGAGDADDCADVAAVTGDDVDLATPDRIHQS